MLIDFGFPYRIEAFGQDNVAFSRGLAISHCTMEERIDRKLTPISFKALPRTTSDAPAE
jgi:hypothetical protein